MCNFSYLFLVPAAFQVPAAAAASPGAQRRDPGMARQDISPARQDIPPARQEIAEPRGGRVSRVAVAASPAPALGRRGVDVPGALGDDSGEMEVIPLEPMAAVPAAQVGAPATGVVTAESKWCDVQGLLGAAGAPVAFNRAPSTNTTNPFGATLFFGYDGLIFEVATGGHISSVTLFPGKNTGPR